MKLKKVLSVIICISMLMSIVTAASDIYRELVIDAGPDLNWIFSDTTGTLTIYGSGKMNDFNFWDEISYREYFCVSPWNDKNSVVEKVVIRKGVTSIGEGAFSYFSNLTSIVISDTVTSIYYDAFSGCSSLTDVYYAGSEEAWNQISIADSNDPILNANIIFNYAGDELGNNAVGFGVCGKDLIWELDNDGILTISGMGNMSNYNYYNPSAPWRNNASNVKSVIIKNGVTSVGNCAFAYCTSLTSITIPDSVTSIGDDAFDSCSSLTSMTVDENNEHYSSDEFGVLFNKDKTTLIQYPRGNKRTSYIIPESVTSICDSAFYECTSLASVMIGDSVISIGKSAFSYCSSLTSIEIPDSVTSIGNMAFSYCYILESITVDENNAYYSSDEYGVLFNKDKTTLIQYPRGNKRTSYVVLDSVTSIGVSTFNGCSSLKSVEIGNSVTSIGNGAFHSCSSLENVYYKGTTEEWENIDIGSYNDSLLDANIIYLGKVEAPAFTEDSEYTVNETVGAVVAKSGAKSGESLDAFMSNITTAHECVRVVNADGAVQTEVAKLTTGYKVQLLSPDGSVTKTYTIVILGDADRNGRLSISDVSGIETAILTKPDKETVEFLEADVDGNSRLSIADASALQSFLVSGTW